jgi:SAM-dependent methyltransferase
LFFELHAGLPREGPGNDATTLRALAEVGPLRNVPEILDIGCGPGAQTLVLALASSGRVTAVDVHQPFLDELRRRADAAGLGERVITVRASMTALPFVAESFDLVWSEGAIFIMGFDAGLRAWRGLLRPGGALVVSELTWLTSSPPGAARDFWREAYPGMRSAAENRAAIEANGYEHVADIVLPRTAWFDEYLTPLERRIDAIAAKRPHDEPFLRFLEGERTEIDVARRYGDAFGYVFYVMRKGAGSGV